MNFALFFIAHPALKSTIAKGSVLMFCPKCSRQNSPDTIYCRQCGFSLTFIQASLQGNNIQESIAKAETSRKPLKVGSILLSMFTLLSFFIIILPALVNGTFSAAMLAVFIPGLTFGLPLIVLGTVRSGRALNALKEQIRFDPKQINQIKTDEPKLLEMPVDIIPTTSGSVTENTTVNLKMPVNKQ